MGLFKKKTEKKSYVNMGYPAEFGDAIANQLGTEDDDD